MRFFSLPLFNIDKDVSCVPGHARISEHLTVTKIMNISYYNPQRSAYQVDQTFALGNALSAIYMCYSEKFLKVREELCCR